MKSKQFILLMVFCFGITINVFSQIKEITRENYFQKRREVIKNRLATSRRETTRQDYYRDGRLFSTKEITDEYLLPDKRHYLEVEKFADRTNKSELVQIGKTTFCRNNDSQWKQSTGWCSGGDGNGGFSNIVGSKFTVEDAKIGNTTVRLYKQYITYKNTDSADKDKEGLSYYQVGYWIDSEGFLLREAAESGLLKPERIYDRMTKNYEYNPQNLKIEVPVNQD
jgi:hypothetical protein